MWRSGTHSMTNQIYTIWGHEVKQPQRKGVTWGDK